MRVILNNGSSITTDRFISGVLRFDCTPIPATLEFQVKLNEEMDKELQENSIIRIGDNYLELIIVKRVVDYTGIIKDDENIVIGAYIAVINGSESLIKPTKRAILLDNASLGSAMRASGNKLKVIEDVPLVNYFCALGATPTYEIARKCAEEACVIYCNSIGKIIVKRLSQIMNQESKSEFSKESIQWVQNQQKLNQVIPTYQTMNADGSTVEGSLSDGTTTAYYPNLDARRVKNLSTVLVVRGTTIQNYSPNFIAGDIVTIDSKKYVILTVAHRFDTGCMGGASVSASKFWLAEVVSV
ncbi:hypothetical protein [Acinetobacter bereziniae]|uniref:hypothetical protein n=1 Tax=Acinetobacter bereziniae TaxID=106648 RepID=UPI00124F870C|nr:hypothetical protein [Acinetobacter bereziniae]MCU4320601.1 hypothetical protein [Acinetobacter bereziniae]